MAGKESVSVQNARRSNWLLLVGGLVLVLLFLLVWCSRKDGEKQVQAPGESMAFENEDLFNDNRNDGFLPGDYDHNAELEITPKLIEMPQVNIGSIASAVVTLQAKYGPIVFDGRPELTKTDSVDPFRLSGSCFSMERLAKDSSCVIEVQWNPTSLLNPQNQIRINWREDSTSEFGFKTDYITIRARSSNLSDCVICEEKQKEAEKNPSIAVTPTGDKIVLPKEGDDVVVEGPDGEKRKGKIKQGVVVDPETNEIIAVIEPKKVPLGLNNRVLGIVEDGTKNVLDFNGKQIGILLGDDTIVDNKFEVLGAAISVDWGVLDGQGQAIGRIVLDGNSLKVVDAKEMTIGTPRVDGSVVDYDGRQIGVVADWGAAMDLNGDVIGVILQDGRVMSPERVVIGHLHQNRLVTNDQGELIGGAVPKGVGVSTGCRSFGVVDVNGEVKDSYGQLVGHALLDGAIVDSNMNEVGGIVRQGLIINEKGRIQGYMNNEGKAVDKTGTLIGCAGPDGMVKAGKKMIGGVMKHGKIVGRTCDVIGSVYPNGVVMNQAVEPVGYVRPDGYVSNSSKQVIGAVVPFGTAIAEGCRLLGMISITGQVIDKSGVSIGCVTSDKNVINQDGAEIGKITPLGAIVKDGNLVGRIRLDGYIIDKDHKIIDCINPDGTSNSGDLMRSPAQGDIGAGGAGANSGVVLDDNGLPTGWTTMGGKCYSESNEILGDVAFNGWIANSQGRLIGFVAPDGIIVSNDGSVLGTYSSSMGMALDGGGENFARIMPDGTALDYEGTTVLGSLIPLGSVGVGPNFSVLGKITTSGFVPSDNSASSKVRSDGSVMGTNGHVLGHIIQVGPVMSSLGRQVGWGNANADIMLKGTRIGQTLGNGLAIAPDNRILGRVWAPMSVVVNAAGVLGSVIPKSVGSGSENVYQLNVYDKNGNYVGFLSPFGVALANGGRLIGKAVPVGMVFDFSHKLLGWVSFKGDVVDVNGKILGVLTQDGLVIDQMGKTIGFVLTKGGATDKNGSLLGSVAPDGSVLDDTGHTVGYASASSFVVDSNQAIIGRRLALGIGIDSRGKLLGWGDVRGTVVDGSGDIGRIALDGRVLDASYNIIGSYIPLGTAAIGSEGDSLGIVTETGAVISTTGATVGSVMGPDYVMNAGALIGRLLPDSLFVNSLIHPTTLGQAEFSTDVYAIGKTRTNGSLMINGLVMDAAKTVSGAMVVSGLPQTTNLKLAGMEILNGSVLLDKRVYGTSAGSNILFAKDEVVGGITPPTTVIDKNGLLVGVIDGKGGVVDKNGTRLGAQMAFGSALSTESMWVGGALKTGFVVDDYALKIGAVAADGVVVGDANTFKGRVLPDGSVAGVSEMNVYNSMPYIGHTVVQGVPAGYDNTVLGRTTVMGNVVDSLDKTVFSILDDGTVLGVTQPLVGAIVPFGTAIGFKGVIGMMDGERKIIDAKDNEIGFVDQSGLVGIPRTSAKPMSDTDELKVLGAMVPEQLVVSNTCKVVGQTSYSGEVIDGQGNTVGRMKPEGWAEDSSKRKIGQIVTYGPVMTFAPEEPTQGPPDIKYLGRPLPDGMVVDESGVVIGCAANDGTVAGTSGTALGKVVERGPIFGKEEEAGLMIGRIDAHGRWVGVDGTAKGLVDANGRAFDWDGKERGFVVPRSAKLLLDPDGKLKSYMTKGGDIYDKNNKFLYHKDHETNDLYDKDGNKIGNLEDQGNGSYVYLYDLNDKIIARLVGCDLYTPDGETKLGSLLADGTIRDINGDLFGTVMPDNKVYNPDGSPKGEFRGIGLDLRKCGLAEKGAPGSSQRTIVFPGMPGKVYVVDPNQSIIDPRTNRTIGYLGKDGRPYTFNGQLLTPPGSTGSDEPDPRPAPVPTPHPPLPDGWPPPIIPNRRKEMSERLSAGGTLTLPGPEILAKAKKHRDPDWESLGVAKNVSSWPVDMSNVLLKDKGIPAVLVHSIDTRYSDVPVTAIVERNVYAEAGRNILIPAGSRLIGSASAAESSGEAKAQKVTISWERLIRPDGAAFVFEGKSADAQGRGGVPAYLDEQLFQKYAQPFVLTAIEGLTLKATTMTEDKSTAGSTTGASGAVQQSPGQQIRQMYIDNFKDIFDQMLEESSNVMPVLFVPSGTRLIAYPQEDLWLRTASDDAKNADKIGPTPSQPARKPDVKSWLDERNSKKGEEDDDKGESKSGGEDTPTEPLGDSENALNADTPLYEPGDELPDELLDQTIDPVIASPYAARKEYM